MGKKAAILQLVGGLPRLEPGLELRRGYLRTANDEPALGFSGLPVRRKNPSPKPYPPKAAPPLPVLWLVVPGFSSSPRGRILRSTGLVG